MAYVSALSKETLAEQAHRAIRNAILSGQLARDQRLIQDELAREFGVSRIPIRDALRQLQADGLVWADERGSFFVMGIGVDDAEEIYDLRLFLEPYAATTALGKMSSEDINSLLQLGQEMIEAAKREDLEAYVLINRRFHLSLYERSGLRRTLRIIENLWSGLPPMSPIVVPGQLANSLTEHDAILAAIKKRNPPALRSAVVEHITHARHLMLVHIAATESKRQASQQDGSSSHGQEV